jgi:HK97 family phage major capsid protein
MDTKQLREKRAKLASDMNAIMRQEVITAADRVKWARIEDETTELGRQIEAADRAARIEQSELALDRERFRSYESPREQEYRRSFANYLRRGQTGITPEERQLLAQWLIEHRTTDSQGQAAGSQTLSYTAGSSGGYLVPAGYVYDVDVATKYYCPFLDDDVFNVLNTATGNLLPYPTSNDTNNQAAVLAESTQDTENPLSFGVVNFNAYKYSSRIIRVSLELMQDSAFNLEDFLKQQFAIRFGRGYEAAFTTGTGSAQPTGILTAVLSSAATPVVAAGSSTNDGFGTASSTVGTNDLIALEHSVDPTYRRGSSFLLHDQSLKSIKQLLDKYGRPLWLPGIAANAPDTILGYPYVINQQLPKIGTAGAGGVVLFGDMKKFLVRKVKDLQILRLDERYADYGQVGFIGFARVDSNLVDAGTHPINSLSQHS